MTLTEFLLARIAEDEAAEWHAADCDLMTSLSDYAHLASCDCGIPARVLAECEAKRRIVEYHERNPLSEEVDPDWADLCRVCTDVHEPEEWPCPTLRALAAVHADHPDYRDEWKP